MTICHVEKFLHMADFFSTGTARGARDKYQVWGGERAPWNQAFHQTENLFIVSQKKV